MKKMLSAVAGAALLAGATLGVANAQGKANGPFADVPTDHWAYQSVEKLRDAGIVIGYPDGTYGGRRAMTRYEFATAIARLLQAIPPATDLSNYVTKDDLKTAIGSIDTSALAKQSDLDALRAEVTHRLSDDEQAIAALRDLVNQFAPELKQLGVDVAAANARIDALDKRVTALEEEVRRVKITGDLNVIGRADVNTRYGTRVVDQNGYLVGNANNKSLWAQPEVYNDFLLNIVGRVSDTAQAVVSIDAGNYLSWLGSSSTDDQRSITSHQTGIGPNNVNGSTETFNLYQAYLTTPVALGAIGATLDVGRFGTQFTPFTLKAINPDVYTYLPQTNSGDVITDGLKAEIAVSDFRITAFAGNTDQGEYAVTASPTGSLDRGHLPGSSNAGGYEYSGLGSTSIVKNLAGARVTFGNPDSWTVGVTGLLGTTDGVVTNPYSGNPSNNFGVYGADGMVVLPAGFTVQGEFALDTIGYDSVLGNVDDTKGNEAWWAGAGWGTGGFNIKADYKQVYTNFASPGYWGNIGSWVNPTNIEGPEVYARYAFTPSLSLNVEGEYYQGQYDEANAALNPLNKDDKLYNVAGGLKYGLTSNTNVDLGYEWVEWDLQGNTQGVTKGDPVQQFITIGVGHDINPNTAVKVLYQIDTYDGDGTNFYAGTDKANGGILVGQASVKF